MLFSGDLIKYLENLKEPNKQGNRSLPFNAVTGMIEVCTGCLERKKEAAAKNPVWRLSEDT